MGLMAFVCVKFDIGIFICKLVFHVWGLDLQIEGIFVLVGSTLI